MKWVKKKEGLKMMRMLMTAVWADHRSNFLHSDFSTA